MVSKETLLWRYATKQYDTTKTVSEDELQQILEAARNAPSSFGLEPWKFIVVTDKSLREKLKEAAWGQSPVSDASYLVVFAARKTIDEAYVDAFIKRTAQARGMSVEDLAEYKGMIMQSVSGMSSDQQLAWNQRQLYIALGFALMQAADLRVDATPMEGFSPESFNELLGLSEYSATALLAVGHRSEEDTYANLDKVRFSQEEVVVRK